MPDKTYNEHRCGCGKLLFRWTSRGLEFKCNRCKKTLLVPFELKGEGYRELCPIVDQVGKKTLKLNTGKNQD